MFSRIIALLFTIFLVSCDQKSKPSTQPIQTSFDTPSTSDKPIRGIYVGASNNILSMIEIAKELSANAVVIDVKYDNGEITCNLNLPSKTYKKNIRIKNIKNVITTLKQNGIYTIARIVSFKDPQAVEAMPELAVKNKDGSIREDKEGSVWLNPYNKKTWEYIINIAKEAAHVGFEEIQFDYVRFSPFKNENVDLGEAAKTISRVEIIDQFFDFAVKELKPLGVKLSADVFGCIIPDTLGEDTTISTKKLGQDYVHLAAKLDFICPMIYPSHYPVKSMGIKYPDLEPYKIIYKVLGKAPKSKAVLRPWLQAFTASYLPSQAYQKYTKVQIKEQIKATYDAGLTQWCLWNPGARYDKFR